MNKVVIFVKKPRLRAWFFVACKIVFSADHGDECGSIGYERLPAFVFSCICIVVVSLLTKAPSKEIGEDFEAVRTGAVEEA